MGTAGAEAGEARACRILLALAALSFVILPTGIQYTGEEAAYTLQAYEQWYHRAWWSPTLLGVPYPRPPLFSWLIAALSVPLGWTHVLAAARLVSALATLGSALMVAAFVRRTGAEAARGLFTALVYLSLWEPLFYYGWLAYSDALMGALVLGGMLAAWLSVRERQPAWLALALILAFAGFLTKALTAYVFVAAALAVAWWREPWPGGRAAVGMLAVLPLAALPLVWFALAPTGGHMAQGMAGDIGDKLGGLGLASYLRHLLVYPAQTLGNLLPAAGVALWAMLRHRTVGADRPARTAGWIAALNFLPYWLSPQSSLRYLMPLYGLAALWLAGVLWTDARARRLALQWVAVAIVLKWLAAAWLFPAYTARVRPDIEAIATDVERLSSGHAFYVDSTAWAATAVAATLDVRPGAGGGQRPPLRHSPADWTQGLVLVESGPLPEHTTLVRRYDGLQLVCRGEACP